MGRAQRKSTVHELCTAHSARRRKKKRGSHKPRRTYDNIYIIIIIYEKSQMYHPCGARFARPIIIQLHDVLVLICTCAVCIVCTNVCVPTYNHIHVQLEVYLAKPCSAEIEGRSVSRTCLVGKVFHTQCVCHTIDLEIFIVKINIAVHASFLFVHS